MSSQLTFIETGWHNHVRPFQYVIEGLSSYGTPPSSPTMVASPLFNDIVQTHERLTNQYFGDNSYTYYRAQDLGSRYRWTARFAPFDTVLLKLCCNPPDYTAPTTNLASSMTFFRSWLQSVGAYTLTEHFETMKGTRAESVSMTVNQGIIDTAISFISREIIKPQTTNPLPGTPVMKAFSDITTTPWTHVDNGSLPLSVNSITYPTDNFTINWANALNNKPYNGSKVIDTNKCMKQHITGTFMGVVGKDLNLEGFFDNVALSNIPLSYAIKPASMSISLTDVNLKIMDKAQTAAGEEEWKMDISFDARLASITP